jgi:hypothetical protein
MDGERHAGSSSPREQTRRQEGRWPEAVELGTERGKVGPRGFGGARRPRREIVARDEGCPWGTKVTQGAPKGAVDGGVQRGCEGGGRGPRGSFR